MPAQPTPQRRLRSLQAAAEYADCSTVTLRRCIAKGNLTGYRLGRVIRVDLNELDAMMRPIPTVRGSSGGDVA